MSDYLQQIKPQARELRAYSLSPYRASIKINQNENPFDAPAAIMEETLRRFASRSWSRYPDFVPASLNQLLAQFSGWQTDGVIAGNGSNELIQALLMVTVDVGKRVLISEPTFALYRQVTTVLGGEIISVALSNRLQFDAEQLLKAIEETGPGVVILCSPNNPTGCVIDDDDLRRILKAAPGLVVVDEAYHEFAEHSVVPLLSEFQNLVVLRTFSKAMGLAALRVGYLLASVELVTEIRKAVLPYNLNAFSQTAAEVAIGMYENELRPVVKTIINERERVFAELSNMEGLIPVTSRANFMIVRANQGPKKIFVELLRCDILVRDVSSYPMLSDYFRFNVGTPEENNALIHALREITSESSNRTS